jgi:hypothetical protein
MHYQFAWQEYNCDDYVCYSECNYTPHTVPAPRPSHTMVRPVHLEAYKDKHNRTTYTEIL